LAFLLIGDQSPTFGFLVIFRMAETQKMKKKSDKLGIAH
jgi:hypothetical protein